MPGADSPLPRASGTTSAEATSAEADEASTAEPSATATAATAEDGGTEEHTATAHSAAVVPIIVALAEYGCEDYESYDN